MWVLTKCILAGMLKHQTMDCTVQLVSEPRDRLYPIKVLSLRSQPCQHCQHCVQISRCVVVSLCCCNVHLTKMCQNGTHEKRESCVLLVVIQKEEHL